MSDMLCGEDSSCVVLDEYSIETLQSELLRVFHEGVLDDVPEDHKQGYFLSTNDQLNWSGIDLSTEQFSGTFVEEYIYEDDSGEISSGSLDHMLPVGEFLDSELNLCSLAKASFLDIDGHYYQIDRDVWDGVLSIEICLIQREQCLDQLV